MKITVFGATGMVGKKIVKYALALGHHVIAFGRNVDDLIDDDLRNPKLEAIKGSVFNNEDVLEAIVKSEIIISALGGSFDGLDKTRSLGIKTIAQQMEKAGLQRIVAIGGLGVLKGEDGKYLLESPDYPKEFLPVGQEHLKAYLTLKESKLNWTFICSPNIKDGETTGKFITSGNLPPTPNLNYILAGDLALFAVDEAVKNEYPNLRVGISATSL